MKLVIQYDWFTPFEASGTETIPIEYESEEALLCDLEEAFNQRKGFSCFNFNGHEIMISSEKGASFDDQEYEIYKLEDWFEKFK